MSQNISNEFTKTKVQFTLVGGAFLSTIFYSMECKLDSSIPTAGTDGKEILINPEFFMSLTKEERIFLLAHEVMHVALLHPVRKGDRNHKIWNIAGDFVINNELKSSGLGSVPDSALVDEKYEGMTTEQVYDELMKNVSEAELPSDAFGSDVRDPAETGNEVTEESLKEKVVSAVQVQKMTGDSGIGMNTAGLKELIDNILNPKVDWRTQLQDYFCERVREGFCFTKRNKHYNDVYLPSRSSKNLLGVVKAYIDVSGSVSSEEIQQYLAEISTIKDILNPRLIKIVPFDTDLRDPYEIERDDEFPETLPIEGRGGTDIEPVVTDWKDAEIVLVFTDGYFYKPEMDRDDVLWVIVDNPRFDERGKVIHVDTRTDDR